MTYKIVISVETEEGKNLLTRQFFAIDEGAEICLKNPSIALAVEDAIDYQKEVTQF